MKQKIVLPCAWRPNTQYLSKQTSPDIDRNKTLEKKRTELQNISQTSIAARDTESLNLE